MKMYTFLSISSINGFSVALGKVVLLTKVLLAPVIQGWGGVSKKELSIKLDGPKFIIPHPPINSSVPLCSFPNFSGPFPLKF